MATISRYSFREGVPAKGISSPFFVLKLRKMQNGSFSVAIVVSKKIDKRATSRNLVKRRVMHALRELSSRILTGADMVIYTRKPVIDASYQEIVQNLQQILKKEGII